jgi:hypothetical protein
MDETVEQVARQLINMLRNELSGHEDAETAIDVYKMAHWIINELDDVKQACLNLAEQDMEQRELSHLRTRAGTAGWTEPQARQLDEQGWRRALAESPELMAVQRDYDLAEARLHQARELYLELPEPRFFIR